MFKPVPMIKLNILTIQRFLDPLAEALGQASVVHLVDAVSQSKHRLLEEMNQRGDIDELQALAHRCENVAQRLGIDLDGDPGSRPPAIPATATQMRTLLDQIDLEFQAEDEAINQLIGQSGTLAQKHDQLESYPFHRLHFGDLRDLNFLYLETGRLAPASVLDLAQALGEKALVLREPIPGRREERVVVLAARKNRFMAEAELKKAGFMAEPLPGEDAECVGDELTRTSSRLAETKQQIEAHRRRLLLLANQHRGNLQAMHQSLAHTVALARAKEKFGRAASLFCVSGWIPAAREAEIRAVVETASRGTAVVEAIVPAKDERVGAGDERVPVQLAGNGFVRPFQSLLAAFGPPRYQDVEPSLFVAISFVLMFGIMFGDVGQGAVLALVGGYIVRSPRPAVRKLADSGYFLLFCGSSALLFGFLYGSVFGYEGWLPALWLSPLHDIMLLFEVTVALGIVCISVGILINIVNRLRAKDYLAGVLDKFGIVGLLFYWGAIGLGLKAMVGRQISSLEVLLVIVVPLAILFVREPLYNLLARRRLLHDDLLTFAISSAVELMETMTGFLGSTVSFVRVGAFALSHAALCFAIYAVVDVLRGVPGSGVISVLVIIAGNLFVILLEGLVVTIQGIRLQYYELFSKYFPGDGMLYQPFTMPSRQVAGRSGDDLQTTKEAR